MCGYKDITIHLQGAKQRLCVFLKNSLEIPCSIIIYVFHVQNNASVFSRETA